MATIKSYTDLSQSKTLSKILSPESADMRYGYIAPYDYSDRMYDGGYDEIPYPKDFLIKNPNFSANEYDAELPCWSLAALIEILPRSIEFKDDKYYLRFMKDYVEYANDEVSITGRCLHTTGNNNLVDASYEMILKLHEHKMLNKC